MLNIARFSANIDGTPRETCIGHRDHKFPWKIEESSGRIARAAAA